MKILSAIRGEELDGFYVNYLKKDFSSAELWRPLARIRTLIELGAYDALKYSDAGKIFAYLLLSRSRNFILLDFFAVDQKLRGSGVGSAALQAFAAYAKGLPIVAEVEDPAAAENEDDLQNRLRRIRFYEKNGFSKKTFRVSIYGEDHILMVRGDLDRADFFDELNDLYRVLYGDAAKNVVLRGI